VFIAWLAKTSIPVFVYRLFLIKSWISRVNWNCRLARWQNVFKSQYYSKFLSLHYRTVRAGDLWDRWKSSLRHWAAPLIERRVKRWKLKMSLPRRGWLTVMGGCSSWGSSWDHAVRGSIPAHHLHVEVSSSRTLNPRRFTAAPCSEGWFTWREHISYVGNYM